LVVPKIGRKTQSNLKNIHYVPSTKLMKGYVTPYPYSNRKLNKVLAEFKPNIIHIHSPFIIGKYFVKYAKKNNIPCLMTFHTKYDYDFRNILKSKLFSLFALKSIIKTVNRVPRLFTVSEKMIDIMYSYGINKKTKINILRNATEFDALPKGQYDDEINEKFKIKREDFLVVYIGRIVKYKNLKLIIESASKLSNIRQDFKFLICGDGQHLK
jgi:glycosyltransferase involved in cell wall biosynthesis